MRAKNVVGFGDNDDWSDAFAEFSNIILFPIVSHGIAIKHRSCRLHGIT
jgi:hypothetical protein